MPRMDYFLGHVMMEARNMGRMEDDKEYAAKHAREQRTQAKRDRFQEIKKTFENEWKTLDKKLKCIVGTSEKILDDSFAYAITVDQRVLNHAHQKIKDYRWNRYNEAIGVIQEKLWEGTERWDLIRPFVFSITDKDGTLVVGWTIDRDGYLHIL